MAFTNNIPLANDQLSISQGQLLGNFVAIAPEVGGVFSLQGAGGIGTAATELAIYNRNDGTPAPQLYLRRQGVVPGGADVPITAFRNVVAAPNNNGYTFFSSGICLKWGRRSMAAIDTGVNVAFDATYPFLELYTRLVTFDRIGLMEGPVNYNSGHRTSVWCENPTIGTALTHMLLGKPSGWVGFVNYIAIGRVV